MRQPQIIDRSRDQHFMRLALELAAQGAALGEVPVGAVLVQHGEVIGQGFNCPISGSDPSAHAEMVAIRAAAQAASNYRLPGSTLYVTLEPCSMCAGLIVHSRVNRVVFGALEPKAGIVQSQGNSLPRVSEPPGAVRGRGAGRGVRGDSDRVLQGSAGQGLITVV